MKKKGAGKAKTGSSGCGAGACKHPGACGCGCAKDCPLRGKTVVVIGGLDRLEGGYSQVVSRLGGTAEFHPGHIRGGCKRLRNLAGKADLLVFFTSINSHGALGAVKEQCKRCGCPMATLRGTGTTSLERALRQLAA